VFASPHTGPPADSDVAIRLGIHGCGHYCHGGKLFGRVAVDEMSLTKRALLKTSRELASAPDLVRAIQIYRRYRDFTMIAPKLYVNNLMLCRNNAPPVGSIVEAGVWRGGMSAGIADMLPGRIHYLFDSFAGLPPAKEIDGHSALWWQSHPEVQGGLDNCRAERQFAELAMGRSKAKEFHLIEGWFQDTLASFAPSDPIAVLRLDGDWYDSTMQCLEALYPHLLPGGLIIIDDYYAWDGCARAVHDYLSIHKSVDRIDSWRNICYIIKRSSESGGKLAQTGSSSDHFRTPAVSTTA